MVSSDVVSRFIIETLRLSGALAMNADEMVADIGLSCARWQVVGSIYQAPFPQPVAHIARDMRMSRQGVQRIVNELHRDGLVAFQTNPHHAKAHLIVLTERGIGAFNTAIKRQEKWTSSFGDALTDAGLNQAIQTMIAIRGYAENTHLSARHQTKGKISTNGPEKHA
jgi:DNA-binding MarR family transcriptional regulator